MTLRLLLSNILLLGLGLNSIARADIPAVQHVVIIVQENRTPDNLFHGLSASLPAADIADHGLDSKGQRLTLEPVPLANTYDLVHQHSAFVSMWDNGKMDGANLVPCKPSAKTSCPPRPQYKYVDPADVAPYFSLAENYGFANRMFQSNQGASYPAHQFLIGGSSQITATDLFFIANNPNNSSSGSSRRNGCDAPAALRVEAVGPSGMTKNVYTCIDHATLTDEIDNPPAGARQGITWRYYTPTEGSIWTAPEAYSHMCQAAGSLPVCSGPDWTNGKIVINPPQVLTDIAQNNLASVSWVIPSMAESDHPNGNDGSGPSWVANVVNAIGSSPYWNNTVILLVWDDWGGWYDHVPPPIDSKFGYYENGFRVPLIVVSAYTPRGYVSNTTHTFGSILRFVETAYGLPVIPPGTFVDSNSDDLSDFFNFSLPPRPFIPVPAPLPPDYFLHDHRPIQGPDEE